MDCFTAFAMTGVVGRLYELPFSLFVLLKGAVFFPMMTHSLHFIAI
jgi:hypothetical protein